MTVSNVRLKSAREMPDCDFIEFERTIYRRGEPILINAPEWIRSLVFEKASDFAWCPETGVALLRRAIVFDAGFVKVGDLIVKESLVNQEPRGQLGQLSIADDDNATFRHRVSSIRIVNEPTILVSQTWSENYGHWIVECLPKLFNALKLLDPGDCKVAVVSVPGMKQVVVDSLSSLSIKEDQIVWLDGIEVQFENLIYPLPVAVHPWSKSHYVLECARQIERFCTRSSSQLGHAKIYVSRRGASRRRLLNEGEIIEILEDRGYLVTRPEEMSFADQVSLFSKGRFIVGPLGAALTNLVFSPDRVKLFGLTNEDMVDDFFYDLAGLKKGQYISLHGSSLDRNKGYHSDFIIDPVKLRCCLDKFEF